MVHARSPHRYQEQVMKIVVSILMRGGPDGIFWFVEVPKLRAGENDLVLKRLAI